MKVYNFNNQARIFIIPGGGINISYYYDYIYDYKILSCNVSELFNIITKICMIHGYFTTDHINFLHFSRLDSSCSTLLHIPIMKLM